LTIDLGNGIKTNAQLTFPSVGKGPYSAVLLVNLGGPQDMNDTAEIIVNGKPKTVKQFWQIAQYLSEKGFAVLRFDKRGTEGNGSINDNVWLNATFNDLKKDAQKALSVLTQQPEVDIHKISIIGHSKGTQIAPRIAIDNPGKIKNIILMRASAQNESQSTYNNILSIVQYAKEAVDKNKDGLVSIKEAVNPKYLGFPD
jgi:esterase/lipase